MSFISSCEWIKSARRLVIRVNFCVCFCREKFCLRKKTVYSGIELICEFAKIWLIITKTCFDSFLLFLLVWLLCKSFWKAVWRVRVSLFHLHTEVQRVHCPSRCFKIVKKSWKRLVSLSFVLKYYNSFSPTFAKRLLTSCVFLSHGETLHCELTNWRQFVIRLLCYWSWISS